MFCPQYTVDVKLSQPVFTYSDSTMETEEQ